jgi:hypothetical protein
MTMETEIELESMLEEFDPFVTFDEWSSDADEKAYASL